MVTDKTKTDTAADVDAWQGEVMQLHGEGIASADIAKAVGKRADTVRKVIKRKTEEAEAATAAKLAAGEGDTPTDPKADGDPEGAPVQAGGTVSAETAQRLEGVAGDSSGDAEPAAELFPVGSIEGDGFSHKTMVKAGMSTEITVAMTGGEVPIPNGTGLLDPAKEGMLLVTYEVADAGRAIPQREGERGDKRIVGYKFRQTVRPVYIERVKGEEGVIEGHFAALLEAEPSRAGALLDRLNARAGRSLSQ